MPERPEVFDEAVEASPVRFQSLRRWVAFRLVALARRISPQDPAVMKFWSDVMAEALIRGKSVVRTVWDDKEHVVYQSGHVPYHGDSLADILQEIKEREED